MARVPGAETSARILVNAQSTRMRLTLSDGTERVVEPWSLLRLADGLRARGMHRWNQPTCARIHRPSARATARSPMRSTHG